VARAPCIAADKTYSRDNVKIQRPEPGGLGKEVDGEGPDDEAQEGADDSGNTWPCPLGIKSMTNDALYDHLLTEERKIDKISQSLEVRSNRTHNAPAAAFPPPSASRVNCALIPIGPIHHYIALPRSRPR
jgi:hypothetical protein